MLGVSFLHLCAWFEMERATGGKSKKIEPENGHEEVRALVFARERLDPRIAADGGSNVESITDATNRHAVEGRHKSRARGFCDRSNHLAGFRRQGAGYDRATPSDHARFLASNRAKLRDLAAG